MEMPFQITACMWNWGLGIITFLIVSGRKVNCGRDGSLKGRGPAENREEKQQNFLKRRKPA